MLPPLRQPGKACVWNCSLCLPRRLVVLVKRKAVNLHELIVKDGDSGRSEENEVQETKGSFDPGGTQPQDRPGNHLCEHILGDQNQPNNPIGSGKWVRSEPRWDAPREELYHPD